MKRAEEQTRAKTRRLPSDRLEGGGVRSVRPGAESHVYFWQLCVRRKQKQNQRRTFNSLHPRFTNGFNCDRLPFFLFFLVFLPCVFLASAAILTSLLFSFFPILMLFLNFSKSPRATLCCSRRHVIGSLQRCNLTVDDEKCLLLDILKWTHRFLFFFRLVLVETIRPFNQRRRERTFRPLRVYRLLNLAPFQSLAAHRVIS